jgi:hypothetical protein
LWYTNLDDEQDHDFACRGCYACGSSDGVSRAIMHPRKHAKFKGLPTALLCEHDVLCHVAKEYSSFVAATRYE